MKAIITKYHGPTNFKPARISARAEGCKTKFFARRYDKEVHEQEREIAHQYASELDWPADGWKLASGSITPDQTAWCFYRIPQDKPDEQSNQ